MKLLTRQQAIDANCKDCNYDEKDEGGGSWKKQIENCPSSQCPFYHLRPVTAATMKERQQAKIATMTPEELSRYRLKQEGARNRLYTSRKRDIDPVSDQPTTTESAA